MTYSCFNTPRSDNAALEIEPEFVKDLPQQSRRGVREFKSAHGCMVWLVPGHLFLVSGYGDLKILNI